jgi:rhodanese-related sulfurtransferase
MKTLLAAILALASLSCGVAGAAEHTKDSLATVQENLAKKKAVLIDVREMAEWKRGHLAGAELVPLSELKRLRSDGGIQEKLEKKLPKDRIIYCHCGSGVRVLSATDILGKLGYDIRPLAAGFNDLLEAGFPAAKDP